MNNWTNLLIHINHTLTTTDQPLLVCRRINDIDGTVVLLGLPYKWFVTIAFDIVSHMNQSKY